MLETLQDIFTPTYTKASLVLLALLPLILIFWEKIKKILAPVYTEASLFLMSATFILLAVFNEIIRYFVFTFFTVMVKEEPAVLLFAIPIAIGMGASLINPFLKRKISRFEKGAMLTFAIIINAVASVIASVYIARELGPANPLLIFPFLNFANALILLGLARIGSITHKNISDVQAELHEIAVGFLVIFIIFVVSEFYYHANWAITFSVCVGYATALNEMIKNWFYPETVTT